MKSSVLSAREFFQLTINSLLELCTHCIDGHCIVTFEGRLLMGLETGAKVELNIHQQDVSKMSTSVEACDRNKSSLAAVSDVDKKMDSNLLQNGETVLAVKHSVGLESLNDTHVQRANTLTSADETDLHSSSLDDGEQSFPDAESVPSAVLQTNGEFMCSWCGVTMKCARAIKRHISTHMSLQSFRPPTTVSCETPDDTEDVCEDELSQKQPEERTNAYKMLPTPGVSSDSSRRLQKPESNKNSDIKWRSYPCKDCDNVSTSSALLQLHRVQMHKPHECQKCGMVLAGRRNFSQHVRNEHPGQHICKAQKSFVCEYCSRTFHDESLLKDHILTVHLGSVEHRCEQCGKVLGSAITLQIHQRQLHERRFLQTCDGCGRQFTRLAGLINHLMRSHPHLLPDKYRRRVEEFSCRECSARFLRHSSLQHHQEIRHGSTPKYMCPVCSRRFSCRRYVFRHLHIHHPGAIDTTAARKLTMVADVKDGASAPDSPDLLQQPVDDSSSM